VLPQTSSPREHYSSSSTPRRYRYPNPGFLGSSSHETIFSQFPLSRTSSEVLETSENLSIIGTGSLQENDVLSHRGARLLKSIQDEINVSDLKDLVFAWTSRGVNFPLAGPFLAACVQSVQDILSSLPQVDDWPITTSKMLFKNTYMPFSFTDSSTFSDFLVQFSGRNMRWETLGLFFAAVSQATIVIPYFESLYTEEEGRQRLQRLMTSFSDRCLDLSLALDCLNDLQLIFHYENCIIHSFVDGDQSELVDLILQSSGIWFTY
jgi:hypothetical protein